MEKFIQACVICLSVLASSCGGEDTNPSKQGSVNNESSPFSGRVAEFDGELSGTVTVNSINQCKLTLKLKQSEEQIQCNYTLVCNGSAGGSTLGPFTIIENKLIDERYPSDPSDDKVVGNIGSKGLKN